MDGRSALPPGTALKLSARTGYAEYTLSREIGRGGSCIVYDASYADNLGNRKLVRIKECYPHALQIARDEQGALKAAEKDAGAFSLAKARMVDAYRKNHALAATDGLANAVAYSADIYEANGTVYTVSVYVDGSTFAAHQGDTLHECISLTLGTARALKRIHEAGYLYLDLKPENILTLKGSRDSVQLFDFDSMISAEALAQAIRSNDPSALRASYTRGYAPLEQQAGRLRQIGRHTDIYSLGAVLFFALWHRTPDPFDCDASAAYDYARMAYADRTYRDALFPALTTFFHRTLASYHADRYQCADDAIAQLEDILALSDEAKPWICSTPIQRPDAFFGRQAELAALGDMLRRAEGQVACLWGVGGIGKSTLARRYLTEHAGDWDARLWLYDRGDPAAAVADDALVQVNTVRRMREERAGDYLARKLEALRTLAQEQRIILVLDDFDPAHVDRLEPLRGVGWTILLISRADTPSGLFPSMVLSEMPADDLARLFEHHAHCELSDDADRARFLSIVAAIQGHTLLCELIARQVANSFLDMRQAEGIVAENGLAGLSAERIDHVRDHTAFRGTLDAILDRLVEADRFSEQDRLCMKLLGMVDAPGIDGGLFKQLSGLPSLDVVNDLQASGWVIREGRTIRLHAVMREYVRAWPWTGAMEEAADGMMRRLYDMIRPAGRRHDGSKQFPEDYASLYRLLRLAEQLVRHATRTTEASQRLKYRLLMDAPVDQDADVLFQMLDLLEDPRFLDGDSILRLYENAAYLRARLYDPEGAMEILKEMKRFLLRHPSAYYLSAFHRAAAVILNNTGRDEYFKRCLRHEGKAIAAARLSTHPDAKKQLISCLLDKATTLLNADMDRPQARRLIEEARPLVLKHTEHGDYERYQYACITAMCRAMDGDIDAAGALLNEADALAFAAPDSDLAIVEHLVEQGAPIRIAMGQFEAAEDCVRRAIELCERHDEAMRYREARFDAWLFLGRVCAMGGRYAQAEEAFEEAERYVHDSPYAWKLPLCPEDVRRAAEAQRGDMGPEGQGGEA
ncbi:MAG: hypothetical protein E7317_02845 [Clostridiales bacterium]|nr:hypothetical protein [Clostridiales bacterium]